MPHFLKLIQIISFGSIWGGGGGGGGGRIEYANDASPTVVRAFTGALIRNRFDFVYIYISVPNTKIISQSNNIDTKR